MERYYYENGPGAWYIYDRKTDDLVAKSFEEEKARNVVSALNGVPCKGPEKRPTPSVEYDHENYHTCQWLGKIIVQ